MTHYCLLCGAAIQDPDAYARNEARYVRLTRYQRIIDVLVDSGRYDLVYFDHDTELPDPYRDIAHHRRNALQEEPGKGRYLHKKWPDVVAVRGNRRDIVVEEERQPSSGKVKDDVDIITRCGYLWVDGLQFDVVNAVLFVLTDGYGNTATSVNEHKGAFRRVVICDKANFLDAYRRYYLES